MVSWPLGAVHADTGASFVRGNQAIGSICRVEDERLILNRNLAGQGRTPADGWITVAAWVARPPPAGVQ